jgi:hypothetical protein
MRFGLTIFSLTEKVFKLWADDGVDAFSDVMKYHLSKFLSHENMVPALPTIT